MPLLVCNLWRSNIILTTYKPTGIIFMKTQPLDIELSLNVERELSTISDKISEK